MTATGKYLKLKFDPFVVYPGAKWVMAEFIIKHLPPHQVYLEPFVGSGAVFFNKEPSKVETLNDINGDIINLFRVMRTRLDELLFAVQTTPWSREEFDLSYGRRHEVDDVERARQFLVRCWQSHKPKLGHKTGWKKEVTGQARSKNYTEQWARVPQRIACAAERLMHAQIENRNGLDVVKAHRSDKVLIYADPPYILSTREHMLYWDEFHIVEHEHLLKLLKLHPGPVLISALNHELYNDMLTGWTKKVFKTRNASLKEYEEILWIKE